MSLSSSISSASSSSSSAGSSSSSLSSSSGASFSSRSTIVAPQPVIRPFGSPEYNYFWIENKSKTNPKLSFYYNYKSHCVVWDRPLPKHVSLPFYAHRRVPANNITVEDDRDLILSDSEDEITKRKRLALKRRNRRLADEEKDNSIQVVSVKKTVKSRRMLDTVWKLYRFPGESLQDVKKRLLDVSQSTVRIKTEKNDRYDLQNYNNIPIKNEPCLNNDDFTAGIEAANKTIKAMEDDSDSDPDNVSFLIKQEYMMNLNYESDSELEDRYEEEIPEELNPRSESEEEIGQNLHPNSEEEIESETDSDEDQDLSYNIKCERDIDMSDVNMPIKQTNKEIISDFEDFEYDYEAPFLLADYFDVEIEEDNEDNVFIPSVEPISTDFVEEEINWTFEKKSNTDDSGLKQEVLNPLYNAPRVKRISKKHLLTKKKKATKKRGIPRKNLIPKIILKREPEWHVKKEPEDCDPDAPIICDMYGTRTINYNHPPKVKIPKWQSCSKLSDSEDSEREFEISKVKKEQKELVQLDQETVVKPKFLVKTEPQNALELRNWFPKQNKRRRQRSRKKSDSSWCESNLSDYSDVDDLLVAQMRMKREKRSTSPESNKESDSELSDIVAPIKKEKKEAVLPSPTPPPTSASPPTLPSAPIDEMESKIERPTPTLPSPLIDEMESKIERPTPTLSSASIDEMETKIERPTTTLPSAPIEEMESKIERPMTSLAVDLSIVKIEKRSSDEYVDDDDIIILERENDLAIHSVDSSSSSCTCSRSSCSCNSSSSSSSSDEEDGADDQEVKKEDL